MVPAYQRLRTTVGRASVELSKERPNAVILLAADYRNIGDIAILEAQKSYLSQLLPDVCQHVVSLTQTYDAMRSLRGALGPEDSLFIQGGGFLGDLYPQGYFGFEWIVRYFPDTRITTFPLSMVTTSADPKRSMIGQRSGYLKGHDRLTLCARERVSLDMMRSVYGDKIIYSPDIVLSTVSRIRSLTSFERSGALVAFRGDHEKSVSSESQNVIVDSLKRLGLTTTYHDNLVSDEVFAESTPEGLLRHTLDLYRRSKVVLTDRLHGMIFATITGTPCIVLPNNNHKIRATYEDWIKSRANYVFMIDEGGLDQIPHLVDFVTSPSFDSSYRDVSFDFSELDRAVAGERS